MYYGSDDVYCVLYRFPAHRFITALKFINFILKYHLKATQLYFLIKLHKL